MRNCNIGRVPEAIAGRHRPSAPIRVLRHFAAKSANAIKDFAGDEHVPGPGESELLDVALEIERENLLERLDPGRIGGVLDVHVDASADDLGACEGGEAVFEPIRGWTAV